jgi:hypothetical protein
MNKPIYLFFILLFTSLSTYAAQIDTVYQVTRDTVYQVTRDTIVVIQQESASNKVANPTQKQKKNKPAKSGQFFKKLYIQPSVGVSFAQNSTLFNGGLTVGYKLTKKLSTGVGLNYTYSKNKSSGTDFKSETWGGNLFARYVLLGPIYIVSQYEVMSTDYSPGRKNVGYDAFLVGGGFLKNVGRNGKAFFQVMYNFSYDDNANFEDNGPYDSPYVINAGFLIGF